VTAHFADGITERGALLIGADGGRSVVRKLIYGDTDAPRRYSGVTVWRSIVQLDSGVVRQDTSTAYLGHGRAFVIFPVGQDRVYWALGKREPEGGTDTTERVKGIVAEHLRELPALTLQIAEATPADEILRTDIYDRDPERVWTKGRVALLGDAAHLTSPFVGQGAGISMEDAVALAKELALTDGLRDQRMLVHALNRYEQARIPHTSEVVLTSRRRGQVLYVNDPRLIAARNMILRRLPARVCRAMLAQTLTYEV
jgi:2-polyprenyl-6-methoxyphenol hydroxylase-like FAD-dependent oxidoreductase